MRIALVVTPFLTPQLPSLGLTQIRSRLREIHGDAVDVRICYTTLDFYKQLGLDLYLKFHSDATYTFINDWLFRQEAFDEVPDNSTAYLARFYPGASNDEFRRRVITIRETLGPFIEKLIDAYELDSSNIIGVNATFSTVPGLAFCRHVKKRRPDVTTVMGGASLYKEMGVALSLYHPYVDYVCSGSGLVSFPELVGALMKGGDADSINGIFTKRNVGTVGIISDELDINHDIDLDYDDFYRLFNERGLDTSTKPRILMETSRGCYWRRCKFCGLNEDQLKYHVKTPENAIREIRKYIDRYEYDIEMVDNVMPKQYAKKVAPHIRMPEGRLITYEIRSDFTDEEMRLLSEAGIRRLQPGIETFSSDVHTLMNKGVDAFQCINMLKLCLRHGILSGWNLMIGFPGMTGGMYESIAGSISKLMHLLPPIVVTPVRFDRYSYYWVDKDTYGLDLHPFGPYSYIYPYDDDFLNHFAYYFEDRNYGSERLQLLVKYFGLLQRKVNEWKQKWESLDIRNIPKLYLYSKNGETRIFDSRGDETKDYPIEPAQRDILTALEQPHSIDSALEELPGVKPNDLSEAIDFFNSAGLLFSEGDRHISLVIHGHSDKQIARVCAGLQRTGSLFQKYIKV